MPQQRYQRYFYVNLLNCIKAFCKVEERLKFTFPKVLYSSVGTYVFKSVVILIVVIIEVRFVIQPLPQLIQITENIESQEIRSHDPLA